MLNKIIQFSVRNKLIIGLFTLGLIVLGVFNVSRLSIDALPDITSNQVQVITVSPTLAAPEVERLVTFPIEQANANIPGIQEMRSISRFGLSVVTIVFNDETDIYWARQQVAERLNMVKEEIPVSAGRPELAPVTTGLGEIYQYVLRPKKGYESKYDLTELRSIQDWIVRRQLIGIKGVADVSSFGGNLKQYEVAVRPDVLKSMNISVADVFHALEQNNQNSGGAYIEKGPSVLFIRTEGLAKNIEDIGNIVVKHTNEGIPVYIKSIAEVKIGKAIRYGAMTLGDKGEVAGAVVLMLKGANASQVAHTVKIKIDEIKKTLPEGVVLETFYDRTKMVDRSMSTVQKNLLEGALIVVFVLVLFLGNLRAGLIVASVIPLSMLFAVSMMNLFGVSGNLMSLGALDFGLIVDGAVIIVEAVMHRLLHSKQFEKIVKLSQPDMDSLVESSSGKILNSAVFGQVIILIVYLPILSLSGIEGKMFSPMAKTVMFALLGAFILSFTYVPMITSLFISKKINHKEGWSDKMMNALQRAYKPALQKVLAFPKTVIAASVVLLVVAVFIFTRLGGEFIPELEEGDFAVDARILTGSSLNESVKNVTKAASLLESRFPEVEKIVTRIGASEIPTDPMPMEMMDIIISLKPKEQWTTASSYDELANKMSATLQEIPGMTAGFQFPVQMRFNELISGARQDVVCKIFGENLDSLSAYAHRLGTIAGGVNGAADIYVETVTGLPQIEVRYNRPAMAHYQLDIADVNQLIRTAFAGESAGMVYENERRFDLVVRLNESKRTDVEDVQQLLLSSPLGMQVPLYQVATVEVKEGPNQIQRENAKRRVIVGFNVRGRDVQTVVKELEAKIASQLKFSEGYYITYGGQFQNFEEASKRLSIAVPAALLLILVLLYFAFGSLKYGILIFSAIPLSAIGGIMALWIRGMPFSISAGVGFIALFGVAVLNGIVLIAEFNRLKKEGLQDMNQIIIQGTQVRLRPVLMTASVASLGFLPMAISNSAGSEVQRPLATVVMGGLLTATVLTLLVLPVLYKLFERVRPSKKSGIKTTAVIVLLMVSTIAMAQQPVQYATLDDMLQMAAKQNLQLQAANKQADYWKQLQSGIFDPSKTQIGGEYGGINSMNNDTRFFINQSFSLPVVYQRQRDVYKAQENAQKQMAGWKQAELEREVKYVFFQLADMLERKKILQKLDSVYSRFQQSAQLRLQAGEANVLEKTTAEAQLQQLKLQQQQADADIGILQQQLQLLLNTESNLLPDYTSFKKEVAELVLMDTSLANTHPEVQLTILQEKIANAQVAADKARLSPDFSLGYANQSIIGYQSPDGVSQKYYSGSDRFHIVNITLGVPIFNKATKAKIRAGKVSEEVAKLHSQAAVQQIQTGIGKLKEQYRQQQRTVQYYEQTGLQQAELIYKNARLSFEKGEISYLEWTMLMNNAVNIQLGYLESVSRYNQTVIQLEYLTTK